MLQHCSFKFYKWVMLEQHCPFYFSNGQCWKKVAHFCFTNGQCLGNTAHYFLQMVSVEKKLPILAPRAITIVDVHFTLVFKTKKIPASGGCPGRERLNHQAFADLFSQFTSETILSQNTDFLGMNGLSGNILNGYGIEALRKATYVNLFRSVA